MPSDDSRPDAPSGDLPFFAPPVRDAIRSMADLPDDQEFLKSVAENAADDTTSEPAVAPAAEPSPAAEAASAKKNAKWKRAKERLAALGAQDDHSSASDERMRAESDPKPTPAKAPAKSPGAPERTKSKPRPQKAADASEPKAADKPELKKAGDASEPKAADKPAPKKAADASEPKAADKPEPKKAADASEPKAADKPEPKAADKPEPKKAADAPKPTVSPDAPFATDGDDPRFGDLGLPPHLLATLDELGYEVPSPIQARTIPTLLEGRDLLGQAQTGTGKTAAFSLPLLAKLDLENKTPQALVLVPTRELALQVTEAIQGYGGKMKGLRVVTVYGGQSYDVQLRRLKRGAHVVVGTPGRLMDHIRNEKIDLTQIDNLVLDEGDEMLRMGFLDDVEWILSHLPEERQIALFSATMPDEVRRIAKKHLHSPVSVTIKQKSRAAENVNQRFLMVHGSQKLDALIRILEYEEYESALIFVRTKTTTVDLAEQLARMGQDAVALSGDVPQAQRERIIDRLKSGRTRLVIATDVAARGLDVERISHVFNFDAPQDTEAYVHRVGRTGRAGREGEAILFVSPKERRMLRAIERAVGKPIDEMELPRTREINQRRVERFKRRIADAVKTDRDRVYDRIVEELEAELDVDPSKIAATLAAMVQGTQPLLFQEPERPRGDPRSWDQRERRDRQGPPQAPRRTQVGDVALQTYRIDVGHRHGVYPGQIVGALTNAVGLESRYIGRIVIGNDHSIIDLPVDIPPQIFQDMQKLRVKREPLNLRPLSDEERAEFEAVMEHHDGPRGGGFRGRPGGGRHGGRGHAGRDFGRGPARGPGRGGDRRGPPPGRGRGGGWRGRPGDGSRSSGHEGHGAYRRRED